MGCCLEVVVGWEGVVGMGGLTSMLFSLVSSPVVVCPDGVGRSEVQCSPSGGCGLGLEGAAAEEVLSGGGG